ncbi:MAG: glycosyltransferase family 2 protein [Acidobacteria bacterium]|nr:glycosyltransferase family 2 protein [Acidobacteriota bacterium]
MLKATFWASLGLIVYVYLGYPVLIYLLSRRKALATPPVQPNLAELPTVTVLIPAHNEERWIEHKIKNTLGLDYPRGLLQLLVASDGSTDQTVAIAGRFVSQGVEVNHCPERRGKTATLNRMVATARGEIILLTDANALLPPETLKILIPHFADPAVGCVTGERVCLPTCSSSSQGESLYWRYEAWIKHSESNVHSSLGSNGQILAVRKALFPYIPVIGDDFYIPMKILTSTCARVVFEPCAKAWIPAAATLRLELERKIRSHVSLLRDLPHLKGALDPRRSAIWWQFISHHVLRLVVPFAMLGSLALAAFLWNAGTLYRMALLGQAVFYAAALGGGLLTIGSKHVKALYVPFYFVMAHVAVLLAWCRWLRKRHQYAWERTDRILPQVPLAKGARHARKISAGT